MGFEIPGCCGDNDFMGWGNQTLRLRVSGLPAHLNLIRFLSLQPEGPQRVPCSRGLELVVVAHPWCAHLPRAYLVGEVAITHLAPMSSFPLILLMAQGGGGAWSEEGTPWEGAPPLLVLRAASGSWCEVVPLSSPEPLCGYFRGASVAGRLGPTRIGGRPPWGRGPLISTLFLT